MEEDSKKDEFYSKLQDSLDEIPSYDIKLLIGDFNAQFDSDRRGQNVAVRPHGTAKETTKNCERLTSLCVNNELKIGNTFFQHKDIHKKTWLSPDSNTQNETDYICINNRSPSVVVRRRSISWCRCEYRPLTICWWARSGSS